MVARYSPHQARLLARVAHLYYERHQSQAQVARRLGLSQSTVSRYLRLARENGVVRIAVAAPAGTHAGLEEGLRERYGLREALVADGPIDGESLEESLGKVGAPYVERVLEDGEVIGLSSWSENLLHLVRAMHPVAGLGGVRVVQILGGLGNPAAEVHANQLTSRLSALVGGEAEFLAAPGVAATAALKQAYLKDHYTSRTVAAFGEVTLALVGIGSLEPSSLIAKSGNVFSRSELERLQAGGAVGDICMRFFGADGEPVRHALDRRVCAPEPHTLRAIPRRMAIAGGRRKRMAVRGALRGGWINILATDRETAEWLLGD